MKIQPTKVFERIVEAKASGKYRYIVAYGGSSSSKTVSILQYLTLYAMKHAGCRITISSESTPIIKKTLLPDWIRWVMGEHFEAFGTFNRTEMVYTFHNRSVIQFIPADDEARFHGLRQDIFYVDEAFYVSQKVWDQADIRTSQLMFASFNPVGEFWLRDIMENNPRCYVDHSTYKDNPFLNPAIVEALESRAAVDQNFYNVYVKGQWGTLEGLIFNNWSVCPENQWPKEYNRRQIGLDFGYSIDPTAAIEVGVSGGEIYLRELLYNKGLTNDEIAEHLPSGIRVVADSSEPKSIEEVYRLGVDIHPALKGPDSILNGIQLMQQFKLNVHPSSVNLVKEFRNYSWATDKNGVALNKPRDMFNHAIDSIRYCMHDMFAARVEFTI